MEEPELYQDVLFYLFSFCDLQTLGRLARCSKNFKQLITKENYKLYQKFYNFQNSKPILSIKSLKMNIIQFKKSSIRYLIIANKPRIYNRIKINLGSASYVPGKYEKKDYSSMSNGVIYLELDNIGYENYELFNKLKRTKNVRMALILNNNKDYKKITYDFDCLLIEYTVNSRKIENIYERYVKQNAPHITFERFKKNMLKYREKSPIYSIITKSFLNIDDLKITKN